jgi:hypothetical protein
MRNRQQKAVLSALGAWLMVASCVGVDDGPPPVVCRDVTAVGGVVAGFHDVVGVYADLQSVATQPITQIDASFYLFDGNDLPAPRIGGNFFTVRYNEALSPGERRSICSNLDASFYYVPKQPLRVARYRIASITFADGTCWQDRFGTYVWVEEGDE